MNIEEQTVDRHEVLLLGGVANSLSVARSLGRNGIRVSIASPASCPASRSRYIVNHFVQPPEMSRGEFYHDLLLRQDCIRPGAVIFACDDHAIAMVATHKAELREQYILDIQKPEQQLILLDKQETLELAESIGVPSPGFWQVNTPDDVTKALPDIEYPVLIKPIHSHVFQHHFHKKLFYVNNEQELIRLTNRVFEAGIEFMLCGYIPGSDTLLSSYYVYRDKDGNKLFEYTKKIERRSPVHFGQGSYHRSLWLPETAEMGRRFFDGIDFTGLGNIEFKLDTRDNQLKVIESNARFTAAQELVTQSGVDMPNAIYQYLVNGRTPDKMHVIDNVTMVLPFEDFSSFRELHQDGQITFAAWLKSLLRFHACSYFSLSDPVPFMYVVYNLIRKRIKSKINKYFSHAKRRINQVCH